MFIMEILLFSLFFILPLLYLIYRNNSHLKEIPKPPCSLILGHYPALRDPKNILRTLTDYTIKYGGIIRLYIPPGKPSVIITDHNIVQNLLSTHLEKAKDYNVLKKWLGTGILTSGVALWRRRRRMLAPCFGRQLLLKNFVDIFESKGEILINNLTREMSSKRIDLLPLLKRYTMDVLCESSMGVTGHSQETHEDKYNVDDLCKVILNRIKTPFKTFDFIYSFSKDYKKEMKAIEEIDSFFYNLFETKTKYDPIEQLDDKQVFTFLDVLLHYYRDGFKLSRNDMRDEVHTFMFGGHDTTATGISFTLYTLARHPKIQEKVMEEQKLIFGNLNNAITASYNDLKEMKYLELVIKEALRLYPPIPAIGRRITSEVCLDGGIALPKNLNALIFIYGIHHNPKYFREPEKFIPERFETDEILPQTYMAFSAGQRDCIGRNFALLQMKSCISRVVRNFELHPSSPDYELELVPEITLSSKNGICVSLERRDI